MKVGVDKFRERFEELQKTAMEFIEMAGFSETSYCNERIFNAGDSCIILWM